MQKPVFHHVGVPTQRKLPEETYNAELKFHGAGYFDGPFGFEWHNFDADNSLPEVIKTVTHAAFIVTDLDAAIDGKELVLEPVSPADGVRVAFIMEGDVLIELLQFDRPEQEVWPHPSKFLAGPERRERITYHSFWIPTKQQRVDDVALPHLKMHVNDPKNEFAVGWVRYDDDAPYPEVVKTVPHIAFEVDNLDRAITGEKMLIEPNSPMPGLTVAFIEHNGAPIEFLQIDRTLVDL